jgi:hypothetical protein
MAHPPPTGACKRRILKPFQTYEDRAICFKPEALPLNLDDRGYVTVVPGATHHSILTADYAPAVVKGIDFVVRAALQAEPERPHPPVFEGQTVTATQDAGRAAGLVLAIT